MKFRDYFLSLPAESKNALAFECDVSKKHLVNVAYGCKKPSKFIALKVEEFSRGLVRREDVLPQVEWDRYRKAA